MNIRTDSGILHVEPVMGTTVTIDVRDQHLTRAELVQAVTAAVDTLHHADRTFSTWRPNSMISQLRRLARTIEHCPAEVVSVLARCAAAKERTEGWFDPWAMPDGFDPTGLVKGWAAQRALRAMAQLGVLHALVNAGGDLAVMGNATGTQDGSGWCVGVLDPARPERLLAKVGGSDVAVATSGSYERGSLAVDPHTGEIVRRLASATVVAADLAFADACATAATAHGPAALDWLARAPGVQALLVDLDGTLLPTAGWPASWTRGALR